MRIDVHMDGDPDELLLEDAARYMLCYLLEPEQLVHVHLIVTVDDLGTDCGDIELQAAPIFRLRLSKGLNGILTLVTLAHELVHLSQVLLGRLALSSQPSGTEWFWDGMTYGTDPYERPSPELPWEVDALSQESDLARHFVNDYVKNLNAS